MVGASLLATQDYLNIELDHTTSTSDCIPFRLILLASLFLYFLRIRLNLASPLLR